MPKKRTNQTGWLRYSGVGFEFVAAVVGMALFGAFVVDRYFGTYPWGLVVGAMLGTIGGGYNLIRESLEAFKSFESESKSNGDGGIKRTEAGDDESTDRD